jgi:hypothetical protein
VIEEGTADIGDEEDMEVVDLDLDLVEEEEGIIGPDHQFVVRDPHTVVVVPPLTPAPHPDHGLVLALDQGRRDQDQSHQNDPDQRKVVEHLLRRNRGNPLIPARHPVRDLDLDLGHLLVRVGRRVRLGQDQDPLHDLGRLRQSRRRGGVRREVEVHPGGRRVIVLRVSV